METVYPILKAAHSGWRYLVILAAVAVIARMLVGWLQHGRWSVLDRRLGLVATVVVDIQALLGITIWSLHISRWGGDPLRGMEHPTTMLLAVIAMHVGWVRARKAGSDVGKYRAATAGFLVTGLLIGLGVARVTGTI